MAKTKKEDLIIARVTVFLRGKTKKMFFEEINRTGIKECHLAREIIKKYYLK